MITVPARLHIRSGWPSLSRLTIWPMSTSRSSPRLVAEGRAQRHQPADVPVVVGAEHDQAAVEAALPLVEVVGRVAGDVGALAVGLDDHPVLVVAELLGAEPQRAVLLVGVAHLGEPLDRAVDRAGLVQVVLVEVDVEVDAEVVQGLP